MSKINISKLKTLTGHKDCVYTLERSNKDHIFFSGAGDGMVVYWDIEAGDNGQLIAKLPNSVYALHYLANHDLLVAGHNYEGIHLLDWQSKKEVGSLKMTESAIFDINSYGDHLYVGDTSGNVSIIDYKKLKVLHQLENGQKSARAIAINKKYNELAVGYSDNMIRIYHLDDYSLKKEIDNHTNSVFTIRYSPDDELLLSSGRDAHLMIWDVGSGYSQLQDIVAHMYAINNIDFSPDGKHFVTCSMDKSIKVWDALTFRLLKVIDKARHAGHGTSVNKLLWTGFKDLLVSASDDRTISIWDIEFNKQV
ncbi:WD40 repeat domain-containing protein [Fulvivirga sp. RKSG066]|uniref:WD40 repeat domain-containing protein n=1 Tax=Fulvivirga aurantia TaxID=2529383 RepID=UPI0012BD70EF|nr:WD40 repeat domain-containing protein [Fulvivirga aurantia]MTI21087.1 WD40 repeat domain-containing protein [Fulvivirga aurantia]